MTLRLQLDKNRVVTFVSIDATALDSSDEKKDRFYDTLHSTLRKVSQNDKIILLGDFNAGSAKITTHGKMSLVTTVLAI